MYDYMLVIGPGRSGSEFLYRLLRRHPSFAFPEIKEGFYYRSIKAFSRAYRRLDLQQRQLLCDVSTGAYFDPKLSQGVETLKKEGVRILLVALLRDHEERAISMMQFRKSRGELSALFGSKRLEAATVRDRLTAETLAEVFRINVDILTITFPALTKDTSAVLDILTSICGVAKFANVPQRAVNESVAARAIWLSAAGHWCSIGLRKLGLRRLLQGIKENQWVHKIFFRPLPSHRAKPRLSATAVDVLRSSAVECRAIVERSSKQLGEGVYFRRCGSAEVT